LAGASNEHRCQRENDVSKPRARWFAVRTEVPPQRQAALMILSFLIPLGIWSAVSYLPFIWHPRVLIEDGGGTFLSVNARAERQVFEDANTAAIEQGLEPATGRPVNPVLLPAPHEVATAMYRTFTREPQRRDDQWFHQSVWHSITIIFWGFTYAMLLGVPLGVLCGTFGLFSRLFEPFVDFFRYMPAPVFGALMVAIMGIHDAPKIAIVFIGTFFQMVLIVANTTRLLDVSLLEAAQTLGADRRRLVTHVIVPGVLPKLFNDLRILIGWAWTYLVVAELIGTRSGITAFIYQQGRYHNWDLVYAAILTIGLIGLTTDQFLQRAARVLFPWEYPAQQGRLSRGIRGGLALVPRAIGGLFGSLPQRRRQAGREIDAAAS
jgi:NitT/TauT family transport system permease protein